MRKYEGKGLASNSPTKILIGMPFGDSIYLMPHLSHTNLVARVAANPKYELFGKHTHTPYLDINRNVIAQTSLDKDCKWCLMTDTDMGYPANLLDRLIARDKDVIGIPYYSPRKAREGFPPIVLPNIYDYNAKEQIWQLWKKVKQTEPFKVDAVASGILLVKTKVFKQLKKPWFPFLSNENEKDFRIIGEDLSFCKKCMEAGIEIWVDPTFGDSIKHWKLYGYSKKDCTNLR